VHLLALAVCVAVIACTAEAFKERTNSPRAAARFVELNGRRVTLNDLPKDPKLEILFPAELEVVSPYGKPTVLGGSSWPFDATVPKNLTLGDLKSLNAPPAFGFIGDAMAALGFHTCDIDHYFNGSVQPPCPERGGFALKLSGDYGDRVPMFHIMIRSTNNAENSVVPTLFRALKNNTTPLKLIVLAFGSKYTKLQYNFAEHLASITRTYKARGIKVILMTRPPVNQHPKAPLWMNTYNTTVAGIMAQAVRDVSVQTGTPCLDVYNLFMNLGDRWTVSGLLCPDSALTLCLTCRTLTT
jgi:hypothetical protein